MSLGFRLFILLLVLFGAAWVYRTREDEISVWLGIADPPPAVPSDGLVGLATVRQTVDLESRVAIRVSGVTTRARGSTRRPARGVLESFGG